MELIVDSKTAGRTRKVFKFRNGYGVSLVLDEGDSGWDAAVVRFVYADRPTVWDFAYGLKKVEVFTKDLTSTQVWGLLRKVGNLRKTRAKVRQWD